MSETLQVDAGKDPDPYTIDGTLTRCFGVIDTIDKYLEEITSKLRFISFNYPESPGDKLQQVKDTPDGRSPHAERLETLYDQLSSTEDRLARISNRTSQ